MTPPPGVCFFARRSLSRKISCRIWCKKCRKDWEAGGDGELIRLGSGAASTRPGMLSYAQLLHFTDGRSNFREAFPVSYRLPVHTVPRANAYHHGRVFCSSQGAELVVVLDTPRQERTPRLKKLEKRQTDGVGRRGNFMSHVESSRQIDSTKKLKSMRGSVS